MNHSANGDSQAGSKSRLFNPLCTFTALLNFETQVRSHHSFSVMTWQACPHYLIINLSIPTITRHKAYGNLWHEVATALSARLKPFRIDALVSASFIHYTNTHINPSGINLSCRKTGLLRLTELCSVGFLFCFVFGPFLDPGQSASFCFSFLPDWRHIVISYVPPSRIS